MKTKMKGLFLSALMVLSIFAMAAVPVSAGPGTTSASEGDNTNPGPTASAAVSTEGGKITEVNLTADSYTERWAGFYGNVTGTISLGDGSADLYQWTWTPADEGEVIASTASSGITWASLVNGAAADVDTRWGFSTGSDQAADAFGDTLTFTIGDQTMTNAPSTATLGAGTWETAIVNDGATAAKTDFLFVVNIDNDASAFNSEIHDFEMIVPTNDEIDATENYYFYVELS